MKLAKRLEHAITAPVLVALSLYVVSCIAPFCPPVQAETLIDSEKTLAVEMFELESQYRELPPEALDLLHTMLNEGVTALGENAAQPKTSEEAVSASKVVSRVLAKHNFFQPTNFDETPDTLGQALTPKELSESEIDAVLTFQANTVRAQEYAPGEPIYFVDCDMASLLILSVFDRLGWDTRLVKAPVHMFLRWHLPNGTTVNWDWTNWDSFEDEIYLVAQKSTAEEQKKQGTYLHSLSENEARGNFIGLIGSNLDDEKVAVSLLEKSIELAPNNPTNLNNLAWIYAIDPDLALEYSEVAIMYAHRAIAADISRAGGVGTLACAYAADGQWEFAVAIEKGLIEKIRPRRSESYLRNLKRMERKKLCQ